MIYGQSSPTRQRGGLIKEIMKLKPTAIKILKDMGAQEGQMELLQAIASYAVFTLPRLRGKRIRAAELLKLWGRERFCATLMAVLDNKITNTVSIGDGSHSPAGVVDVYFDYNKHVAPLFRLRHFTFKEDKMYSNEYGSKTVNNS